jgi:hypothetical protein
VGVPPDLHIGLLHDLLGELAALHDAQRDADHRRAFGLVDHPQGSSFSPPAAAGQGVLEING